MTEQYETTPVLPTDIGPNQSEDTLHTLLEVAANSDILSPPEHYPNLITLFLEECCGPNTSFPELSGGESLTEQKLTLARKLRIFAVGRDSREAEFYKNLARKVTMDVTPEDIVRTFAPRRNDTPGGEPRNDPDPSEATPE